MSSGPVEGATPLPAAKDVRDLLEVTLGRDVDVATGGPMVNPGADDGALVGVYVDRGLRLRALVLFDLALAARAGAAIALVPPGASEGAIEAGALPDPLLENVEEILNIVRSLFNVEGAPHLTLDTTVPPGVPLAADVARWPMAYVPRLDLEVDVKGYGPGNLSIVLPT
ncbi:hypothetical protein [Cellulomonas fimi]|uniref:Uncharacterized protein n=1 Tax=Cellulomonas fimi TaxID=1708 RepID=A0A7Y0LZ26_CELFI|nr:hypothetical protein [Cellulomonas fimi]NMR20541.1 hypothetical protein [Cellulomonas fimi]